MKKNVQRATTEAIKALITHEGIPRTRLAQLLGMGSSLISSRMSNQSPWRLEEVVTIADFFGLSVNDVVRGRARAIEALAWKLDQEARERKAIERAERSTAATV